MENQTKFKFISERSIRSEKYELTRWQFVQLRNKLPSGEFWVQFVDGGIVQWNWTLLQSYLISGLDSPQTMALRKEYLATLPTAV